jgi:hypothetical protein
MSLDNITPIEIPWLREDDSWDYLCVVSHHPNAWQYKLRCHGRESVWEQTIAVLDVPESEAMLIAMETARHYGLDLRLPISILRHPPIQSFIHRRAHGLCLAT